MSSHADHEARLAELLDSEPDVLRRFQASELADCEECRRIAHRHRELVDEFAALGELERDSLARAREVDVPGGRAEAVLREVIERDTAGLRPASGARQLLRFAAVVLALVTLAALGWHGSFGFDPAPASEPDDGALLGERDALVSPRGRVDAFPPFRWNVELPEGGHFIVRVEGEGLELESPWLYGSEWSPAEPVEWPSKIRWTLEVYRASGAGDLAASYLGWAER